MDGAYLSLGLTGADNKVVRKTAYIADIQQHNITGLMVAGNFDGLTGYFNRFQTLNLL
jgi:hypothetical protein